MRDPWMSQAQSRKSKQAKKKKKKKKGVLKPQQELTAGAGKTQEEAVEQAMGAPTGNATEAHTACTVERAQEADTALQTAVAAEELESIVTMSAIAVLAYCTCLSQSSIARRSAPLHCTVTTPALALWRMPELLVTSLRTKQRRPRSGCCGRRQQMQQLKT